MSTAEFLQWHMFPDNQAFSTEVVVPAPPSLQPHLTNFASNAGGLLNNLNPEQLAAVTLPAAMP